MNSLTVKNDRLIAKALVIVNDLQDDLTKLDYQLKEWNCTPYKREALKRLRYALEHQLVMYNMVYTQLQDKSK